MLEGAIAAEAGGVNGASKTGLGSYHYIVRLIAGGWTAKGEVETKPGAIFPPLGRMTIRQLRPGEPGELTRTKWAQSDIIVEVRPTQQLSGDTATASSPTSSHTRGAFGFTVVNGSVIHCVWMPSLDRTMCLDG